MAMRGHGSLPSVEAGVYAFPVSAAPASVRPCFAARRAAVLALVAVAVLAVYLALTLESPAISHRERLDAPRRIVVAPGQTLWDVAQTYAPPGSDWSSYAAALVELNELDGDLQAGQRLRLDRRGFSSD